MQHPTTVHSPSGSEAYRAAILAENDQGAGK